MLCLSIRASEAIVRQIFPNVTDEVLDVITDEVLLCGDTYPGTGRLNPLHYPDQWEVMRENFENISVETIDQMYVNVVERELNSSNPIREVS